VTPVGNAKPSAGALLGAHLVASGALLWNLPRYCCAHCVTQEGVGGLRDRAEAAAV
jgi:hypothetical protein